ncbi:MULTISPECIES: hypothetical protein [unclassified Rathayibacter]|uniref:hypothetical protein n=1 Tax=unclassified Rathayibacter TaxID=2609250 RepID=UPI000A88A540|nr:MULTISPECIES: hypothetical protein [unclassified Rathayibacter]
MTGRLGRILLRVLSLLARGLVIAVSAGATALGGGSAAPSDVLPTPERRDR